MRPLYEIAGEIERCWPNVWFGARPYLSALHTLSRGDDSYGYESAKSVVLYFLSNAQTWRGPDAKRLKAELKQAVGLK